MDRILKMSSGDLPVFLLAFFRVTGVLIPAPVFGSRAVPATVKAFLALVLAILFFPLVGKAQVEPTLGSLSLGALQELSVGLLIGFAAAFLFAAIQAGGQLIDRELGLVIASVLDPVTNEQVSILGQFKLLLATLVYLLIDGHHLLIRAVADSFHAIPMGGLRLGRGAAMYLSDSLPGDLFRIAVQIAAPSIVTLFLITIALAFMARTVPEMNLFVLGFPIRLAVGLVVVAIGVGVFVAGIGEALKRGGGVLQKMLLLLGA